MNEQTISNEFDDIAEECEHITECLESMNARIAALESELKATIDTLCDAVLALQWKVGDINTRAAMSAQRHRLARLRAAATSWGWVTDQPKDYEK